MKDLHGPHDPVSHRNLALCLEKSMVNPARIQISFGCDLPRVLTSNAPHAKDEYCVSSTGQGERRSLLRDHQVMPNKDNKDTNASVGFPERRGRHHTPEMRAYHSLTGTFL
jgi:hypothetical protein